MRGSASLRSAKRSGRSTVSITGTRATFKNLRRNPRATFLVAEERLVLSVVATHAYGILPP